MTATRYAPVLAIASGEGGVGKTSVAVNDTIRLADRVMAVTAVEPAAIVDAYATVKVLTSASPTTEIGIVANNVRTTSEAWTACRRLEVAANRVLERPLKYYGFISEDAAVRDAVVMQRSVVDHMPQADASRCFRMMAARLARLATAEGRGPGKFVNRPGALAPGGSVDGAALPFHVTEVPPCV